MRRRRDFLKGVGIVMLTSCAEKSIPSHSSPSKTTLPVSPKANTTALPDDLDPAHFHMYTRSPLTLETRRDAFLPSPITPNDRFFVRNNLPLPSRDILTNRDDWTVSVNGIAEAVSITLKEIKAIGYESLTTVIQCSGNGRGFFEHDPSGSPWKTGAAGCAIWGGIYVRDLFQKIGAPQSAAKFLTSTGADPLPEGVDPLKVMVERSIPIEKALKDCFLAWEMNGAPLPLTHGGPLRLIVPGYYGCNQIKYLSQLACTEVESKAKIQQSGYRIRPIGEKGAPTQPSMWRMTVKSWLHGKNWRKENENWFYGVAFSGERDITKVEYSTDGETWKEAELYGPDLGLYAWKTFRFQIQLPDGKHALYTRATDESGETQPAERSENHRGYGNNAWRDHAFSVVISQTAPIAASDVPEKSEKSEKADIATTQQYAQGKELFSQKAVPSCGACHTLSDAQTAGMAGPNLDMLKPSLQQIERAIEGGVGAMPAYKGQLSKEEISAIAQYVWKATQ